MNKIKEKVLKYDKNFNLTKIELRILKSLQSSVYNDYTSNNMRCRAIQKTLAEVEKVIDEMPCINEIHLNKKSKNRINAEECEDKELKAWEIKQKLSEGKK